MANTAAAKPRIRKIRRVVTGHDRDGRSVILSDGPSPHVMTIRGIPSFGLTDLWKTFATPADNVGPRDPCSAPIELAPPANGTVVRVVDEFPPDRAWLKKLDPATAFGALGASGAAALARDATAARHPMMHRTRSIDYAIVLAGEIWAILDAGETKLRAGDVLIQRGTNHSWANRSTRACRVAFVLTDARPIPGLAGH